MKMGMSIDDSIENILLLKKLEDSLGNISGNTNSVTSQSLECAIETMRKYQKIQEIVQSKTTRVSYDIGFRQIKKVVEDGNDNKQ